MRPLSFIRRLFRRGADQPGPPDEELVQDGASFFLPSGYRSRRWVSFDDHDALAASDRVWQPDVYELAALLAQTTGARCLIDLGCGHAEKSAALSGDFEIIGIDTPENREWCEKQYDFGTWLSCDLNTSMPELPETATGSSVLICADVIEHIFDATLFLENLSELLRSCRVGVLSTPDRRFLYPPDHLGPPMNPCHVREWAPDELKRLLESAGIEAWVGLTRSNDESYEMGTIIAVLRDGSRPV